jgi:hypothetical protein
MVDRVVSNLPWGRQVQVDELLPAFYRRSLGEMDRVLRCGGRLAVLTSTPQLVRPTGLDCLQQLEISLHGERPTILVYGA